MIESIVKSHRGVLLSKRRWCHPQ